MNSRYYFSKQNLIKLIGIGATTTLVLRIITMTTTTTSTAFKSVFAEKYEEPTKHDKLISVQMITRHGARTPLHFVKGIEEATYTPEMLEPYVKAKVSLRTLGHVEIKDEISYYDMINFKTKLKGGASIGMLTTVGEKQMFDLGRRLREKYIEKYKFLPEKYDPNVVYTRSSHFLRTIRSAKSVLAGMFTEPNDDSIEFKIYAHRNEDDWIFPNSILCPLYGHLAQNAHKLPLLDTPDFVLQLEELNKHLGLKKDEFLTYTSFRDDLIARKVHGKPIPNDLVTFLEKSDKLAAMEMISVFQHNIQISCGLFLNLLLGNIQKAIHKDSKKTVEDVEDHRFIYYSAHDSTIAAVLVAFNKNNEYELDYSWPPFGSDIQIELWKNEEKSDDDYYVKLFYLGKPLRLSTCNSGFTDETKCDLNKFIEIVKLSSVDKPAFDKICSQSVEKYNLGGK